MYLSNQADELWIFREVPPARGVLALVNVVLVGGARTPPVLGQTLPPPAVFSQTLLLPAVFSQTLLPPAVLGGGSNGLGGHSSVHECAV